jgi:MFS family permease
MTVRRRSWIVVILLMLFMVVNLMDKTVLGLSGSTIKRDLGLSDEQFGAVGSALFLLFCPAGIAVGFLATRVRARPIVTAMVVVWSLSQGLAALPGAGLALLAITRISLGAAEGPAYAMANHTAFTWFPERGRTLPSSVITVGGALGVAVGGPLLADVIGASGWRAAFALTCALGVGLLLAWLALGTEGPYAAASALPDLSPPAPYRRLLTRRTALGVLGAGFAAYWMLAVGLVWLPQFLQRSHGYDLRSAALLSTGSQAVGVFFMLGAGLLGQWLLRRGRSGRIACGLPAGLSIIASAVGTLALTRVGGGPVLVVVLLLTFAVGNAYFPLGQAALAEIVGTRQRPALLGTVIALASTSGVLGPYLAGVLIHASGFQAAFDLTGVIMMILGVLTLYLVDPVRDRPPVAALAPGIPA